jgi:hypothetical protein
MVLIEENQSTWRKTCASVTLSTVTDLEKNLGLRRESPANNLLSHGATRKKN